MPSVWREVDWGRRCRASPSRLDQQLPRDAQMPELAARQKREAQGKFSLHKDVVYPLTRMRRANHARFFEAFAHSSGRPPRRHGVTGFIGMSKPMALLSNRMTTGSSGLFIRSRTRVSGKLRRK